MCQYFDECLPIYNVDSSMSMYNMYVLTITNSFDTYICKYGHVKIEIMKTSSNRMIFSDYFNQYLKGTNSGRSSMWIYI